MEIPPKQRMEKQQTLEREHSEEYRAALRRAVTLAIPHAYSPSQYGTFDVGDRENAGWHGDTLLTESSRKNRQRESWDELIERLFEKDESGHMVLKKSSSSNS